MNAIHPVTREILHFHLFCGLGAAARGMNRGRVQHGPIQARFRCLGGVDSDPAAVRDFGRLAGVPATLLDLFDRDQFEAFHGAAPPAGWRAALPDDIRRAAGGERPHIVFLSAPCKGFSGLLSETRSASARYQALNRLTLRGVWLMLEAWSDDPPELIVFENVPRIMTRGRALLDQIGELLRRYGYAVAETTHDCGELGGLAQSRKRFLLVARHQAKVPPFLYEPPKRRLRGVGEVLDTMPLPGDPAGGPMHRIPLLQWKTWVRLAFVEAGSDWRSLNKLRVAEGVLQDFAIAPETTWHSSVLGVRRWDEPSGVVTSRPGPTNGANAVADPRRDANRAEYGQYGVLKWETNSHAVTGKAAVGAGTFAVADPRHAGPAKHCNEFRIVPWGSPGGAVTSAHGTGQCLADPRAPDGRHLSKYRVTGRGEPAGSVIAASTTGQGAFAVADLGYAWHPGASTSKLRVTGWEESARTTTGAQQVASGAQAVADPRTGLDPNRPEYRSAGQYGVVPWDAHTGAISQARQCHTGPWSVADPRCALPRPEARLVCRIQALDGTWHRPFTTLELAALQSLVDPEEMLELDGLSDAAWRERIGNAVPPAAARAIAETMGLTLLLAWAGEGFALSSMPIWVRPIAVGLAVCQGTLK